MNSMIIKAHPDIRDYYLDYYEEIGYLTEFQVIVGLKENRYHTIGYFNDSGEKFYYLGEKDYKEEDMIKIIKMLAFL